MISNPFYITGKAKERPLRVMVLGDNTGGFNNTRIKAARAIYDALPFKADYVLHVGDVYDGRNDTNYWPYAGTMKYYSDFLDFFKPDGVHTPLYPLSNTLRFYPSTGNHDVLVNPAGVENPGATFKDWFNLTDLCYSVDLGGYGLVEVFVLNTTDADIGEGEVSWTHGTESMIPSLLNSPKGVWWQNALNNSTAIWKITLMHYSPYASVPEGSDTSFDGTRRFRFPFKELGNDLVISGHEHVYERLEVDGLPYIVQGVGGASYTAFTSPLPDLSYVNGMSKFRHNANLSGSGVCILEILQGKMKCNWYTMEGGSVILKDSIEIMK